MNVNSRKPSIVKMVLRQQCLAVPDPPWDAFREIVAGVPRLPAEGTRRQKRNLILEYLPYCS